jgi:DeoR family suf operon transcriptional repressor
MPEEIVSSDNAILDLLRKLDSLTVSELAESLKVTATAVRQRLNRLMAQGFIDRKALHAGRGRPSHRYALTSEGRRKTGSNFSDLAMALWQEIRSIEDPDVRRGLLQRISRRMVDSYADQIEGDTVDKKMQSIADLFAARRIPFTVDRTGDLPVLTALACPYPELAEQDHSVCAMERMMFSDLLGQNVRLDKCRLDGATCCTFETS